MKVFIPFLILMSLWITQAVAQTYGPPTNVTTTPGDRSIMLTWEPPINIPEGESVTLYTWRIGSSLGGIPGGPTARSHTLDSLNNGTTYQIRIEVRYFINPPGPPGPVTVGSPYVSVTPLIPAPTSFTTTLDDAAIGDRQVTLNWTAPSPVAADLTGYEYSQNGGTWISIGSTSTSHSVTVQNGISYAFRVRAVRGAEVPGLPSRTVTVTPLIDAPGTPGTLNVQRVEDTAILTWSPPSDADEEVPIRYEYSSDGGSTWTSTGSTDTTYTVTGLKRGETYTFLIRAVYVREEGNPQYVYISHRSRSSNSAVLTFPKRRVIQECPVGWVRSDGFAGRTRRVLLYEVNLEMDMSNPISIYKPVWVAIYVHPDEGLENLEGWKLQVALPYNQHREYPLTAENSVVVDAGFVEGGFAFIENPEEDPFPMVGIGFTGSPAPGFDYRLYDETGKRVDFGISCYKRGDVFQVLKEMEDPRVLRNVSLKDIDWNASWFIRSEWTVPVPVNGFPGAPSLQGANLVGTWADLKKQ